MVDGSAEGVIRNDDQGFAVVAERTTVSEGTGGSQTVIYRIVRSGELSGSATVDYAVSGANGGDASDTLGGLPSGT